MKIFSFLFCSFLLSITVCSTDVYAAAYYIDEFTLNNGINPNPFNDTFSDGVEPPAGPHSGSDYNTNGTFAANRESGGLLELNSDDGSSNPFDFLPILVAATVDDNSYYFSPTSGGYVIGDVNNDGSINIVDALYVARESAGLPPAGTFISGAADVNCDGAINIVDALLIARHSAGMPVPTWCPSSSGDLIWSATTNPHTNWESAEKIAIDSAYMYIVGADGTNSDSQWRIEKRNLSNGSFAAGFGSGGVITSDLSTGTDIANGIAIDSSYMYVVGTFGTYSNTQWRIEKRSLSDGSLTAGFGTGGVVISAQSGAYYIGARDIVIDSNYMYVVGSDNNLGGFNDQWRIEKRSLSNGSLIAGFGSGGVVTSNPSTDSDMAYGIAIDSSYMYVVGSGNTQWRIEKRSLSDGSLTAGFGTGGVVTSSPGFADSIAIDSSYIYVVGSDNGQWRIEKRSLTNGTLIAGFGTGGVVTSNPGIAWGIAIDSGFMYIVGHDNSLGFSNAQWRIEKRSLSDGSLSAGFGTGGVITSDLSTAFDGANSVVIDLNYIYVVGEYGSAGDYWYIEARQK